MKAIVLIMMLMVFSAEKPAENIPESVQISVKGMVCSFCAQGIEKKLKAFKEVKSVDVNLDEKKVNIKFQPGQQVPQEKLTETIKNSGFDVLEIKSGPQ
jgi:copper chaperone CopZ